MDIVVGNPLKQKSQRKKQQTYYSSKYSRPVRSVVKLLFYFKYCVTFRQGPSLHTNYW